MSDAASDPGDATSTSDGELTSLVRRWVSTRAATSEPPRGQQGSSKAASVAASQAGSQAASVSSQHAHPVVPAARTAPARQREESTRKAPGLPDLPPLTQRLAVLINAHTVGADEAGALLGMLADYGSVGVCRAYADWSAPTMGAWVDTMRHRGLQSFHHFGGDLDVGSLVAMVIDAVDIARESSVDLVVIAGDLRSSVPLVHRLHAAGVRVLGAGPDDTPHEVRAICDEFIDVSTLGDPRPSGGGKHRA